MHCGFVVNLGNATYEDVYNLIKLVQKVVKDKFDVELETEVKIIGEE
jgi:UDP-N-acetylmuramate dehydrogenase